MERAEKELGRAELQRILASGDEETVRKRMDELNVSGERKRDGGR